MRGFPRAFLAAAGSEQLRPSRAVCFLCFFLDFSFSLVFFLLILPVCSGPWETTTAVIQQQAASQRLPPRTESNKVSNIPEETP